MKINHPIDIKDELIQDLKGFLGENFISVLIHGPSATALYVPGETVIQILTIVRDNSIPSLMGLNALEKKWNARKVHFSFFLTLQIIQDSSDVFPLEFMEMQRTHILLEGEDPFKTLELTPSDLRLQCERELLGKLIHLRREYIRNQNEKKKLDHLLKISYPEFLIVFRGCLMAAGVTVLLESAEDVCRQLESRFKVQLPTLIQIARHELPKDLESMQNLFVRYVPELECIKNVMDQLEKNAV